MPYGRASTQLPQQGGISPDAYSRAHPQPDHGEDVRLSPLEEERKKSKCDYLLDSCPTDEQVQAIEDKVNEVISQNLPVTVSFMPLSEAGAIVDLSKLPDNVSDTLRIVRVGDYDACACIGAHVSHTAEIGRFKIISHDYDNGRWRVRFRLEM